MEDVHQRGLAGTIAADQADVVVGRNQPVDIFEEKLVAEAFSGAGKLDHEMELSSHKLVPCSESRVPSSKLRTDCMLIEG